MLNWRFVSLRADGQAEDPSEWMLMAQERRFCFLSTHTKKDFLPVYFV